MSNRPRPQADNHTVLKSDLAALESEHAPEKVLFLVPLWETAIETAKHTHWHRLRLLGDPAARIDT